ncbi:MAG: glycosyltransferase family 2 protein, partial [Candidatus Paceibacterota bacterium]
SFFGNGNAKYKKDDFDGYADTVFLGCFWTKDLREIGGFNTANITSQDLELNLRLKEKYGECVYVSSNIKCFYFPRKSFRSLFKQYFKHARGRLVTILLHKNRDEFRGFFPFIFLLSLFGYFFIDLLSVKQLFSPYIFIFLLGILMVETLRVAIFEKDYFNKKIWADDHTDPPGIISNFIFLLFTIIIMHLGHFFGFLYQLVRNTIFRVKGW